MFKETLLECEWIMEFSLFFILRAFASGFFHKQFDSKRTNERANRLLGRTYDENFVLLSLCDGKVKVSKKLSILIAMAMWQ